MEKTFFKNQVFQVLIIAALVLLICWNIYAFLISKGLTPLFATIVQIIVLVLVMMKHKHAKMGIKIWAIIMMLGPGLIIIGKTIKLLIGDDMTGQIGALITNAIILIAGLAIYNFNESTVEVRRMDEDVTN